MAFWRNLMHGRAYSLRQEESEKSFDKEEISRLDSLIRYRRGCVETCKTTEQNVKNALSQVLGIEIDGPPTFEALKARGLFVQEEELKGYMEEELRSFFLLFEQGQWPAATAFADATHARVRAINGFYGVRILSSAFSLKGWERALSRSEKERDELIAQSKG